MHLFIQYFMVLKSGPLKNDIKKLEAFEMRCYRKALNITWEDKIHDEDVLLKISSCIFKPKRILARITESQLSWFGHVCRMSNMRLPKHILMEMVPGTNRQGRDGKMILLLAAPSSRLIGMLRIGKDGLILFMEPTSFGSRCKDR